MGLGAGMSQTPGNASSVAGGGGRGKAGQEGVDSDHDNRTRNAKAQKRHREKRKALMKDVSIDFSNSWGLVSRIRRVRAVIMVDRELTIRSVVL
jgi:hypothetical protein